MYHVTERQMADRLAASGCSVPHHLISWFGDGCVRSCKGSPVDHGFDVVLVQLLAVGSGVEGVLVSPSTPCCILATAPPALSQNQRDREVPTQNVKLV